MSRFGRFGRLLFKGSITTVQFACFIHLFNQHVAELTFCVGPSMLPTCNMTGDIMLVEHISQRFKSLEPGDVIVCMSPSVPGRSVLKRIIGMPGDNICIDPTVPDRKYFDVPQGHVWVGGDNLSNSTDSRSYGPVAMGLIRGKVLAKAWPEFTWIQNGMTPVDINQYT
ncbi:mitochondrial inner membrane peptidase complex catalytic subunit [Chlamydoabsidia padenii]|nr:mitochondrial inner membrane peptidase complex catalytic subunit [Chlamydoabsidia padenii]